ncbi:MAG TPA: hypothetical protein PK006_07505 [Saprospiraceae bacterium]|nr:hypothetical protein [Saprospiraceae bacterium]
MKVILNNPYRTVGLLVGATAKEQTKQINKLKMYLEAEQDPQDDFSFPTLGNLHRTLDNVNEAAAKLNLDSDKMSSALFWFYDGKTVLKTDEEAFNAIKEADLDQVISIWTKLTSNGEVSQRNASAFSNLSTLYLSGNIEGTKWVLFDLGISLKLKFLESDFIKELKALATHETYKISKKELQLIFLNQIQSEIEKSEEINSNKFLEIISKQTFSAKEDFLKGFVQKPIEQIEKKIEEARSKRKINKSDSVNIGETLQKQTLEDLSLLKSILGQTNIKYGSIADKVANELLQCSIDYFNYFQEQESEIDYLQPSWNIAKLSEKIAVGKLTKDRILDSLNTLEEMKDKEILHAIQVLQSVKNAYEINKKNITEKVLSMPLDRNQSINWYKVNKMIDSSIDWDKVVSLIQEVIPLKNIIKIKNINNKTKISEYKNLVSFILDKLNNSQQDKIKYIKYWNESVYVQSELSAKESNVKRTPTWVKWLVRIFLGLFIIYLIWGEEGVIVVIVSVVFFILAAILGWFKSSNR